MFFGGSVKKNLSILLSVALLATELSGNAVAAPWALPHHHQAAVSTRVQQPFLMEMSHLENVNLIAMANKTDFVLVPPRYYSSPCDAMGVPDSELERQMLNAFFSRPLLWGNIRSLDISQFQVPGIAQWEEAIMKMPTLKKLIVNDTVFSGLSRAVPPKKKAIVIVGHETFTGDMKSDETREDEKKGIKFQEDLTIHVHLVPGQNEPRWHQDFLKMLRANQLVVHSAPKQWDVSSLLYPLAWFVAGAICF